MSQRAPAKVANTTAVTSHVLSLRAFSVLPRRQDVLLAPAIRFTFTLDPEVICRAYLFLCGDFILTNMVIWRQNHWSCYFFHARVSIIGKSNVIGDGSSYGSKQINVCLFQDFPLRLARQQADQI